jgi:nucleotide-binding universal stress UspA family protein
MTYRTIFLGPIFAPELEEKGPPDSLINFALELSLSQRSYLAIGVGSCTLPSTSLAFVPESRALVGNFNRERGRHANELAAALLKRAQLAGLTASTDLVHEDYSSVARHFVRTARTADVSVLQPDDSSFSLIRGIAEEVLFGSGRPVVLVPSNWREPFALDTVLIAWDGSAKAARAIGDALPLINQANRVEVISITDDSDTSKRIVGADIAPHVSRYNKSVEIVALPSNGDVASALANHAKLTRAGLIVMGAYGHAKLREFVLGGVTRSMLQDPPVPVLMSY